MGKIYMQIFTSILDCNTVAPSFTGSGVKKNEKERRRKRRGGGGKEKEREKEKEKR